MVIRDTPGHEETKSGNAIDQNCKDADFILLCYSVVSKQSFDALDEWLDLINQHEQAKNV